MATSSISNTHVAGAELDGVTIVARLQPGPAFRASGGAEVDNYKTTTYSGGTWSLDLERQADIAPAGTWWEIEEQIPATNGGVRVWSISVGSSDASLQASRITPTTDTGLLSYLTQAVADARYALIGSGASGLTVNVKDAPYDAVGNGVADDTAAIQGAIDAVFGNGGGAVFFPVGTYKITSTLVLQPGVWLQGAGYLASRISVSGAIKGIKYEPSVSTDGGIVIADIGVDGDTSTTLELFSFKNTHDVHLVRVNPHSSSLSCVKFDTCTVVSVTKSRIESYTTNGVWMLSTNAWELDNSYQSNSTNGASAVRIETSGFGTIPHGGNFEGSNHGNVGVRLIGANDITISPYFERYTGPCVYAETTASTNILITQTHLHCADSTWIDFSAGSLLHSNIRVIGNSLDSSFNSPSKVFNAGSTTTWRYHDNPLPAGSTGSTIVGHTTAVDWDHGYDIVTDNDVWAHIATSSEVVIGARGPSAQAGLRLGGSILWLVGSGSPESAVAAPVGSFYIDTATGEGYLKTSGTGNTGWKAITHA